MVLQRRVRSLLLEALRTWRAGRFECCAIEEALQCIQRKTDKFEEKGAEIRTAAAGKAWLSIKEAVLEVLQRGASQAGKRRPNERQSGIVGISWDRVFRRWCISWPDAEMGKQRHSYVPIKKFLQQGHDEEAATEAALGEAKARRKQLALDGKLPPPKRSAAQVSSVRGVDFHQQKGKWRVRFNDPASKKDVHMSFDVQADAEAKARKIAKKFGLPAEKKLRM